MNPIQNILNSSPLWHQKAAAARKANGSAKRLKGKYRWIEQLDTQDLIDRVLKANISVVAREIGCPHYVLRGHLQRHGFEQDGFKRPEGSWCKGLTKETDSRIQQLSEKISQTRK